MSKTNTCTKCLQPGHTASSCKRYDLVQCVACKSFKMTKRDPLQRCEAFGSGFSPSPVHLRKCSRFVEASAQIEHKRREALRNMGSVKA